MKPIMIVGGILFLVAGSASSAFAAGCIKGAVVGGLVGHVAGHHGVAGAAVGCAVGHHEANKHDDRDRYSRDDDRDGNAPR